MNGRERFRRVMNFQTVDRVPNYDIGPWIQTYKRWLNEGLSPDDVRYHIFLGGEPYFNIDRREYIPLDTGIIPPFDEEVLDENERYVVMRNSEGIVTRALKEGSVGKARMSMDQYLEYPVKKPEDFIELKKRYNPLAPVRYPLWWDEMLVVWKRRDYPLIILDNGTIGLYGCLRKWMGTTNLSYAFFDQPRLVHEMLDFIVYFLLGLTKKALAADLGIDYFNFFEDFAGKGGPLISPKIFREFLMPRYKEIIHHFREHGVRFFWLDSDGNIEVLIPLLIECGINAIWPLEVAAGMDPVKLRKKYKQDIVLAGGIDKRVLAMGKDEIRKELLDKLPWLIEQGGYFPFLDHAVPPDVSYENYCYYIDLKQKIILGKV